MGANLDNELFNTAKEKRTKKLKDEKADSIRNAYKSKEKKFK